MHSELPLVEPIAVQDIFISGIAEIEDIGDGMFRYVLYTVRTNPHDRTTERVVVASLVMTKESIARNLFISASAMGLSVVGNVAVLPTAKMN